MPPRSATAGAGRPVLRLLGPLDGQVGDRAVAWPASRKARALLVLLAAADRPVERSRLVDLLWDGPADPRGELRWCLSRLRAALGARCIRIVGDAVGLASEESESDLRAVAAAFDGGLAGLDGATLEALADGWRGELAEGLALERCPGFESWLAAERLRWHERRVQLLACVTDRQGPGPRQRHWLARWLAAAPHDLEAHRRWLAALLDAGRGDEARGHLQRTLRQMAAAGIDAGGLHAAWLGLRPAGRAAGRDPVTAMGNDAAKAMTVAAGPQAPLHPAAGDRPRRRPIVVVLPFGVLGADAAAAPDRAWAWRGDAVSRDVIRHLARQRMTSVIAAASIFALAGRQRDPAGIADRLEADYVVSGVLSAGAGGWRVDAELAEARSGRLLGAERVDASAQAGSAAIDAVAAAIAAVLAAVLERHECERARAADGHPLSAWQLHHRALGHLYRFDRQENARARHLFEQAVRLDPDFARPHAGLSFTHWQDAFQHWGSVDGEAAASRALGCALTALRIDERDPDAHCALARALWLQGHRDEAIDALRRSVALSPSHAFAHYGLSFVQAQAGDPAAARSASDESRRLSPYDPLLFAMLGTRGMAEARLGHLDEAADWMVRAARCANAHAHIHALAAFLLPLAGRRDEAGRWLAVIRRRRPDYAFSDFRAAYRFEPEALALYREGAERLGVRIR